MKRCPNQNCYNTESYSDELQCCPFCGSDLVLCEDPNHIGNGSIFMDSIHSDNHQENSDLENEHSNVKIGNDNTFTGGVHSTDDHSKTNSDNERNTNSKNQVHTNSHNTTNNTTIYEAVKSNSQRLEEDKQAYRLECKKLFKNGFISKEGEDQLRELQTRLNLADEIVSPIKDEIRQQSRKRIPPTAQVISGIRQTKSIIEFNNNASLLRQLKQLESWMREYDDDTLKLVYYQMSAILEPAQYTNRYEKSAKNEYWEAYWAYIAYLKQAQDKQSFDARALSGKLGLYAGQPESNDVILHLAGRLMQDDPIDEIAKERNTLTANYTIELKPLLDAIDELLQKNWERETIEIRPSHAFYINALFTNFVETQKAAGKKIREDNERISRVEREKQQEIKRQKEFLLQKFQEVEDVKKACKELGISYLTFRSWVEEDSIFNSSYYEIIRSIEDRRAEEEQRIRMAQKIETETKKQKSDVVSLYQLCDCNLNTVCSRLSIDIEKVMQWRETDKNFDNELTSIEQEFQRKLQNAFIKKYASNACNLWETCADMGISMEVVNDWRKANKSFDEDLTRIKREHDRQKQEAIVRSYASNDCNLRETCNILNISEDTVREWKRTNSSFNESLLALEQEHEKELEDEKRRYRNAKIKKIIPYILILLLAIAAVVGNKLRSEKKAAEKAEIEKIEAKKNAVQKQYNEIVASLERMINALPSKQEDVSIERDFLILIDCSSRLTELKKIEQSEYIYDTNTSDRFIRQLLEKADAIQNNAISIATSPLPQEFRSRGESYIKSIDEFKQSLLK